MQIVWNKNRTAAVQLKKIREINTFVIPAGDMGNANKVYNLRGWFNRNEFFDFGMFESKREVDAFVYRHIERQN